ncbi:hypothetical protein BDP27DRAFT_1314894 [Rhodocollybia butyracea]|uniref:Uncharacterized protein n=1 Tax=Rhodocollybia butyracea TaxID=206335 RepID=A0A9P5Q6I9_9AGAR|nr:hypothetical protein BDP27DRAFT_1314894 [Rhodocollybia butyracea]
MPDTPEVVYNSLIDLGLPEDSVTLEEFVRLCRGPLQDALSFISEHLKGRAAVIEARTRLLCLTESLHKTHSQSKIKPRSIATGNKRTADDIAVSALAKARKDMEIYSSQLESKAKSTEETHIHINTLKSKLQAKNRVDLLLDILEKKEQERIRRFEEMGKLLADLKKKSPQVISKKTFHHHSGENHGVNAFHLETLSSGSKPRQTEDTLTALHAYHIRIARLTTQKQKGVSTVPSREARLRSLVAQKLGISNENDPEVSRVFQGFIKVARSKAQKQVSYCSPDRENGNEPEPVSVLELNELASDVKQKTINLQAASDLSLELASVSGKTLGSITQFRNLTIPHLQESLDFRSNALQSYIAHLRAHIVADNDLLVDFKPLPGSKTPFGRQVRRILGLIEVVTSETALEEVERLIRAGYSKNQYLESATTLARMRVPSDKETQILDLYQSQKQDIESCSEKLLARKLAKADLGHDLVQDIELILKETHDVVGNANDRSTKRNDDLKSRYWYPSNFGDTYLKRHSNKN